MIASLSHGKHRTLRSLLFTRRPIVAAPLAAAPKTVLELLDLDRAPTDVFGVSPAGEREHIAPAGSIGAGGSAPILDPFDDVTQDKPAIFFSLNRVRLAKGRDGGDLSGHVQAPVSNACSVSEAGFMFRKRNLISAQLLAEARAWADELTAMEIRGPGDLEAAWRRLEARYSVPYSTFWSLRYRDDLKDIWASLHCLLRLAVEAERARRASQMARDNHISSILNGDVA